MVVMKFQRIFDDIADDIIILIAIANDMVIIGSLPEVLTIRNCEILADKLGVFHGCPTFETLHDIWD